MIIIVTGVATPYAKKVLNTKCIREDNDRQHLPKELYLCQIGRMILPLSHMTSDYRASISSFGASLLFFLLSYFIWITWTFMLKSELVIGATTGISSDYHTMELGV